MSNANPKEQSPNDAALLYAYTCGDQSSFRLLVDRHAPWVFASALRQLRDNQLAEDATQAVFIILCQRSTSLTTHANLPGWLFNTTHYCVRAIQRAQRRRHIHERRAAMQRLETQSTPPPFTDSLDNAVARLPAKERAAVVMRFYQQMDFPDIAAALGITELAARKRVTRAIESLRGRLGPNAGVASLSVAALHGIPANSAALSAHISHVALTAASGVKLAAGVTTATKGALTLMATTHLKIAAATGIAVLLLTGTTVTTWKLTRPATAAAPLADTSPVVHETTIDAPSFDAKFEDVYKQPAGRDDVLRVLPPFIDSRLQFFDAQFPGALKNQPQGPNAMIVLYLNGKPMIRQAVSGSGNGYKVADLMELLLGVAGPYVEGSPALLRETVPGDFIVRGDKGLVDEDWRRGLERMLEDALGGKVKLNFIDADRPVHVLRGKWAGKHLDGTPWTPVPDGATAGQIEVYGNDLGNGNPSGNAGGHMPEFSLALSKWINEPVVIESPDAPYIAWHLNGGPVTTDPLAAHDPDLVIKHIEQQTGLTATLETRKVHILTVDWQQ